MKPLNIHATCISLKNKGILLLGPSGSGKSDLALRAIMQKNAKLVADDRVDISLKNNNIYASCPAAIQGLLEVRGIGIISLAPCGRGVSLRGAGKARDAAIPRALDRISKPVRGKQSQPLKLTQKINLAVELVDKIQKIERFPEPEFHEIKGIKIKKIKLCPFELSALDKLVLALNIL